MPEIYGFDIDEWNAAKEEMRDALAERARVRGMIPYSELVNQVTTISLEPNSYALAAMLGENGHILALLLRLKVLRGEMDREGIDE